MKSLWLKRSLVVFLLPLLGWQVYCQGQGGMLSEQLKQQEFLPYEAPPPHYVFSSSTLTRLAEKANEAANFEESEQLALRAFATNITSGEPASHLLQLYASQKRSAPAAEVADLAGKLWPAHTYTQSRLADYWARQQRLDKLLPIWNALLTRNGSLHATLFPVLRQLIQQPEHQDLFTPYLEKPPTWWNGFFTYLTQNADLALLDKVYTQRQTSNKNSINKEERTAYVNRLLREQDWQKAYQIWQMGAPKNLLEKKTLVFDGGFEGESSNTGFDWQISQTREVSIKPDATYGIKGKQAIHIRLKKDNPIHFQHLAQTLLLPAGDYQLNLRYRLDTFKNPKGLRWRIHCLDAANTLLTESHALKGQKSWATLNSSFTVPPQACNAQRLRLEADSPYRHDHTFEGNIWFDDIEIQPIHGEGEERAETP